MEFGFLLKKFVGFFVEPLGIVMALLTIGIFYLYKQRINRSKIFLLSGLSLLFLFSYPPFANFLVSNLENQYSKYDYKQAVSYIHVLGNGHTVDATQPISSQLSDGGAKRVVEGVIIYKHTPNSKLIFTGYSGDTNETNAKMNAKLAEALGVKPEDMIINGNPVDTKEEAEFAKVIVQNSPFVVVTSASHMPRAMILFKSLGMQPQAAPTNFYKEEFTGYLRKPTSGYFYISTLALHEYFGILWAKIKG